MRTVIPARIPSRPGAFTLIELLVCIGVVAILAALLFPSLRSARERSSLTKCLNNLRQTYFALESYANESNDYYPKAIAVGVWGSTNSTEIGWMQQILPYAGSAKIFRCPRQPPAYENDYSYFLGSRAAFLMTGGQAPFNRRGLAHPSEYILSGDTAVTWVPATDSDKDNYSVDCLFTGPGVEENIRQHHSQRVNVLFADGHVKAYTQFLATEMTYSFGQAGVNW